MKDYTTWLSSLHPYPAMIADDLALRLSKRFVRSDHRVLDPFCGTARTLMSAAAAGAYCVGVDINPLAHILLEAKASDFRMTVLESLLAELPQARNNHAGRIPDIEPGRSVRWFSDETRLELASILAWINSKRIERRELYAVVSVISATVREVSYSNKSQWKLHRMSPTQRSRFQPSAWQVFERRLRRVVSEATSRPANTTRCRGVLGDSRHLREVLRSIGENKKFDLIITSPPYGDSRTTVQYGGMSSICLGVLQHIRSLKSPFKSGGEIDASCLGGQMSADFQHVPKLFRYWHGGQNNEARRRVVRFLSDLEKCLQECSKVLKQQGRIVFVVSRRSAGGWRLKLDVFLKDVLRREGFLVERQFVRKIQKKILPGVVNRLARSSTRKSRAHVSTMRNEIVLVFHRTG